MAEEGYGNCPICQAVLPVRHDGLNEAPMFARVFSHINTHSTWAIMKASWRARKEAKRAKRL